MTTSNPTPASQTVQPTYIWRALITTLILGICSEVVLGSTLPSGFAQSQVGSRLTGATAMTFAPDGRIFVSEELGTLRVIKDGVLLPQPFLTVDADNTNERGLSGVAFDPDFATTGFVYIYYTAKTPALHNRVSRFTASAENPDVADPDSEVVLLDIDDSVSGYHNGGALHFGHDGKLYVTVGEDGTPSNAQTLANLRGKILRINRDGTIPEDNPFYNTATGRNRAIWALGLRNPFTAALNPRTGSIYINDVGSFRFEEINEAFAGANYGWPGTEGYTSDPRYVGPIYAYAHGESDTTGCAIIGGAFYEPEVNVYPTGYLGKYFFGDHCNGWIQTLDPETKIVTPFATGVSRLVDIDLGPDGNIYYLSRGTPNLVYRIAYTGILAPQIGSHPEDVSVSETQPATFSIDASGEAPLNYQWLRDDAEIAGATATSYTLPSAVLADSGAAFRCRVSNAYGTVTSNPGILTVTQNRPPAGVIISPEEGRLYSAGETIEYSGQASDEEDGNLVGTAFTWHAELHHDQHTHPFMPPTTGSKTGSFTIPTVGETSSNVWYRLHLTVTDSEGRSHTSYRDLRPRTAAMTFTTSPPNLKITLDGGPIGTPSYSVGVVGMIRTLGVISPQVMGGITYEFVSWSDGGEISHQIATPPSNTTYTATFRQISSVDLIVTGSDSPDPATLGTDVTYTLQPRNRSATTATDVVLTDVLPDGMSFVSAESTLGSCSAEVNIVTCNLGNLAKGQYAIVKIRVRPLMAGNFSNNVGVTATEFDHAPENNTLRQTTAVVSLRKLTYLTPSSLPGGCQGGIGKVLLSGRAPAAGVEIILTDSNPAAGVPARVIVPAGASEATFPITTTPVTATQVGEVSATLGPATISKPLYVRRIGPLSVSVDPNPTMGPTTATGTVTLECTTTRDILVTLSSSDTTVATLAQNNVVIPAGSAAANFAINVADVTGSRSVTIQATANSRTTSTVLTVEKAVRLYSLTFLTPSALPGGCSDGIGKVTLAEPAPSGGVVVALSDTNPAASVPASVTIPAGARDATFAISTVPVTATNSGQVSATLNGSTLTKSLQVRRIGPVDVEVSPNPVTGPSSATGTVTLECAAAPNNITVSFSSSNSAVANPALSSITIPAGSTTGVVHVNVAQVSSVQNVTITATANSRSTSTLLTVTPPE
jgi:uncharacterized repeat protein (TIGR01451 family)